MSKDLNKIVNNVAKQIAEDKGIELEKKPEAVNHAVEQLTFRQKLQKRYKDRNHERFERMKKNPEILQARQELKDEFLSMHPRFAEMTNAELQQEMIKHAVSEEKIRKQKLRNHIETFSDGVIAVIITIMLLEIPVPSGNGTGGNYWNFISAVGVFLVSFIVIANFWFNHHKIFAVTEEITEGTIVQDFIFMGLLSVLPLLTKWTIAQPTWFSALNYGVVIFLILVQQEMLNYSITRDHFKKMPKSFKFWRRIWLSRLVFTLLINVLITLVAMLSPSYGHWLFVIVPIFNFFMQLFQRDQQHEFEEPVDGRDLGLPHLN